MQPIAHLYPLLEDKRNIVITMHQKPDGDAMGSALALFHFLKKIGHNVTVVSPTNWAKFLNWMPGCNEVVDFEAQMQKATALTENADILFCLDFNAMHRTKKMETLLLGIKCVKVLIDHHEQPAEEHFDYGVSNILKSSTCEMVYDFIVQSPFADKLDLDMATCIYTGIMTDTGSFRFAITSAHTHKAVAHLKELGLNHSLIHENIYDNFLESRLRFIGNALLNRLDVLYEYNTAVMAISRYDLMKYQIQTGDTEGLVNYLLTIEGIKVGALLIDRTEERKWSFRSKGDFDVNELARNHFEGGGHKNAAGGRSSDTLEESLKKFKEVIKLYEKQLA
ncbi:DHH family phosphoesterase [Parafilimonas terrae]|uniref:Phosphoesterase RecJ domain-containing protein n=1 Tax=Parafilimonas terrae TaxID=1465490 RepID=A0A1I5YZP8_9BACT|nr:bifunctional oligoribonuclease/PAP phosphatase NrnA [Parafilimonas terrae]SFQ49659.1 phosphoesterase RecJ domain-containing protein [Parafilimonas terrae]